MAAASQAEPASTSMAAKQLLSVEDHEGERRLLLHEDLRPFLLSEDVADKPVIVISIAGDYRKGKSFLLNSMCRWLKSSDKSRWLDEKDDSFPWKSGSKPHTKGISMSHPIPVTLESGEEAILLLMDTQGIFDGESTLTESTKIFALSTLLSSVQIYNLQSDLQSNNLDCLQVFAEHGRLAMENTGDRPFQDLLFLIRDWYHTQDHPLGGQGGNDLVEKRLSGSNESVAQQRRQLRACFRNVNGYLLPHPGHVVAGSPNFAGDAEDMDPAFKSQLEDLLSTLLSPEKLPVKMNGNRPMTCRELTARIKAYTDCLGNDEFPDARGLLEAVAGAENVAAVGDALDDYVRRMERLLSDDAPLLHRERLCDEHRQAKKEALRSMKKRRIMRDPTKPENYYTCLLGQKMDDWFKNTEKFSNKCDRDYAKASKKNEALADECIEIYKKRTASPERGLLDPWRYLPRRDSTIKEKHAKANKEVLEKFRRERVTFGSHTGSESRRRLETAVDKDLNEAMTNNSKVKVYWAAGIGVTCVVAGSAVLMKFYGWLLTDVLLAIGGVIAAACLVGVIIIGVKTLIEKYGDEMKALKKSALVTWDKIAGVTFAIVSVTVLTAIFPAALLALPAAGGSSATILQQILGATIPSALSAIAAAAQADRVDVLSISRDVAVNSIGRMDMEAIARELTTPAARA